MMTGSVAAGLLLQLRQSVPDGSGVRVSKQLGDKLQLPFPGYVGGHGPDLLQGARQLGRDGDTRQTAIVQRRQFGTQFEQLPRFPFALGFAGWSGLLTGIGHGCVSLGKPKDIE